MSMLEFKPTGEKGDGGLVYEATAENGAAFRLTPWRYSDRRGWRVTRDGVVIGNESTKAMAVEVASAVA